MRVMPSKSKFENDLMLARAHSIEAAIIRLAAITF